MQGDKYLIRCTLCHRVYWSIPGIAEDDPEGVCNDAAGNDVSPECGGVLAKAEGPIGDALQAAFKLGGWSAIIAILLTPEGVLYAWAYPKPYPEQGRT